MNLKKYIKPALIMGLIYGLGDILFSFIFSTELTPLGILFKILGGFIFGFLMAWWFKRYSDLQLKKIEVKVPEEETILKVGGANYHYKNKVAMGKLVLTDRHLIFESPKNYNSNLPCSFSYEQIKNLRPAKSMYVIENSFEFESEKLEPHKFVVENPKEWIEEINSQNN